MKRPAAVLASALVALVLALPRVAEACPVCAGNEEGGYGRIIMLGIMILIPFGIATVIFRVLRAAQPDTLGRAPSGISDPFSPGIESGAERQS